MKDVAWSREDSIVRLRRDVWRYVTQAAATDDHVVLVASALMQMPAAQVRYLAQLHFILSDEVGRLLEQMPFLIRRLTTTSVTEVEVSAERLRGSIRWGETFAAARGDGRLAHVRDGADSARLRNPGEHGPSVCAPSHR